jgi:hypothetical protein
MTLITMEAGDAVAIASLINLTDAKTPRLDVIHLDTALAETAAYGTDRYALGRVMVPSASPSDRVEWKITAAGAKFITANVKPLNKWNTPGRVTFDVDTESRAVSIGFGASAYTDTWPADTANGRDLTEQLAGVLEHWERRETAAPVSMSSRLISKLSKLSDGFTKVESWLLELGASPSHGNPDKPGPLRATSGRLEVLIQPRLTR